MRPMNVLLRADSGERQGAGHVMRCLTLGEALLTQGHDVTLMGEFDDPKWLLESIDKSGIQRLACDADSLEIDAIAAAGFDWVVVDSYRVPAKVISRLNERVPCLAIVDGDMRGIQAELYLDANLRAVTNENAQLGDRILAGSEFTLVRDEVLKYRREENSGQLIDQPRVVGVMGGSDPQGVIVDVARSLAARPLNFQLDLVASPAWATQVESVVNGLAHVRILEPTMELPAILGSADVIVSAAGTSAWDICTMAIPSVLVAVVDNQLGSLAQIRRAGVALTVDATIEGTGSISDIAPLVASLVNDPALRAGMAKRCRERFDGNGKFRVVDRMEQVRRS